MKKKRTISKQRSSYKKSKKNKRSKKSKKKSGDTIQKKELIRWLTKRTSKKSRKKKRKRTKKKKQKGGSVASPPSSERPETGIPVSQIRASKTRQSAPQDPEEAAAAAQVRSQRSLLPPFKFGQELPSGLPPQPRPPSVPPPDPPGPPPGPPRRAPPAPPVVQPPAPPEEPQEGQDDDAPPASGWRTLQGRLGEIRQLGEEGADEDEPPVAPPRPAEINENSPWVELTHPNLPPYYFNEETEVRQGVVPEEGIRERIPEEQYERIREEEEEGEEEEGEEEEGEEEGLTQRTPVESNEPREETTKWGKFLSFFKGTEYEQFIEQSGQELKQLYLDYLEEYFQDIQTEDIDIDTLQAKYLSFVEKYYQEAIEKDKQLLEKLKNS